MDCSLGKSESSIHPFNHSQTQPNEHNRMHLHQVWLIVVEEDLWIQTNPSIKPVNEKDGAQRKHHLPKSIDWREGRLLNSKLVTFQNMPLPITNVFSDWYLLNEILVIPDVLKRPIHKSSISDGINSSSVRFLTKWLVGEGDLSPKEILFSKPEASNDDEMREWILEDWRE